MKMKLFGRFGRSGGGWISWSSEHWDVGMRGLTSSWVSSSSSWSRRTLNTNCVTLSEAKGTRQSDKSDEKDKRDRKEEEEAGKPPLFPPSTHDLIGPPDEVTNLRPVVFFVPHNEGPWQKRHREAREDTFRWSSQFWRKHNTEFAESKETYISSVLSKHSSVDPDKNSLSSSEMSVFYKEFLNEKWRDHLEFNKEWQKRNFKIVCLAVMANVEGFLKQRSQ